MEITLSKSTKPDKKFMVKIDNKTIHFGSAGMSDFTINKDPQRKQRYINRHKKRENWSKSGIKTAGYWSKNILWNKTTIRDSIKNIENRDNIKIKYIK